MILEKGKMQYMDKSQQVNLHHTSHNLHHCNNRRWNYLLGVFSFLAHKSDKQWQGKIIPHLVTECLVFTTSWTLQIIYGIINWKTSSAMACGLKYDVVPTPSMISCSAKPPMTCVNWACPTGKEFLSSSSYWQSGDSWLSRHSDSIGGLIWKSLSSNGGSSPFSMWILED